MADSSDVVMRKLTARDIPSAVELATEAGWNQTSEDWWALLELTPDRLRFVTHTGRILGSTPGTTSESA